MSEPLTATDRASRAGVDTPTPEAGSSESQDAGCFHCGLPVAVSSAASSLAVLGAQRYFCCPGCQAVCNLIIDAGLEDYYRHRTETAVSAARPVVPEFLQQLDLYDNPGFQKDFVREGDSWREASLILEDIRCPAGLWLNEKRLRSLHGVVDVSIDDTTQRARVRWDPQVIQLSEILKAITDIGYIAHPYDPSRSEHLLQARKRRSIERLIFAGIIAMMVMNFSIATYIMGAPDADAQFPLWVVVGQSIITTRSIRGATTFGAIRIDTGPIN